MKRKTKLTPFAKIIIVGLIILGARYAFIHQDEIISGDFFNFNDTTKIEKKKFIQDSVENISKDKSLIKTSDTLTINIVTTDSLITINTLEEEINVVINDTINTSDTLFFRFSEQKNKVGQIIIN